MGARGEMWEAVEGPVKRWMGSFLGSGSSVSVNDSFASVKQSCQR